VGKSTLFNALTKNNVLAANYPFATIEPNVGVVGVPDDRLAVLAKIFTSEKILPAAVSFVDIAGIVKGASEGAGLGNKFLANIRESDAICQVIRVFKDGDVVHVDGNVDPKKDMETINTELCLADLQTLEKAIPRLEKEVRTVKEKVPVLEAAKAAAEILNQGQLLRGSKVDIAAISELQLLTAKPFLYVFNVDAAELADNKLRDELAALVKPAEAIFLDAKTEAELADLDAVDALEEQVVDGEISKVRDDLSQARKRAISLCRRADSCRASRRCSACPALLGTAKVPVTRAACRASSVSIQP
jgi:GTP-binding protein YchF